MTKASSYQMLRGTVIICTGLYQWLFMKKKFTKSMVMAMVLIILGLIVAEISNLTNSKEAGNEALIGDFMVFGCMFLNAWNWSMREKALKKYKMNTMNSVGLEGLYGLLFMAILLPLMAIVPKYSSHVDDVIDGFSKMGKNPELLMVAMGVAISTAFSNNAALMMIKERSATLTMIVGNYYHLFFKIPF